MSRNKKIGIAAVVLVALSVSFYATYKYMRLQHRRFYRPLETQEVFEGVYTIRDDYVNGWYIKSDCGLIAMDTAMNADVIRREMAKLGLKPEDVKYVFLSHSDAEHAGELKIYPNAKVYMAEEEVQIVDGSTYRIPIILMKNKIDVPYSTLSDGQVMDICGLKIKCILTPGHTLGSMSYLVNDTLLFGGDTLNLDRAGNVTVLDKLFVNMDVDKMIRSIDRLSKLEGVKTIFTLHFGHNDFGKAFASWKAQAQ